jgi:hypothetical protein
MRRRAWLVGVAALGGPIASAADTSTACALTVRRLPEGVAVRHGRYAPLT